MTTYIKDDLTLYIRTEYRQENGHNCGLSPNDVQTVLKNTAYPELLEACKAALAPLAKAEVDQRFDGCAVPRVGKKALTQLRDAINKAEGNPNE